MPFPFLRGKAHHLLAVFDHLVSPKARCEAMQETLQLRPGWAPDQHPLLLPQVPSSPLKQQNSSGLPSGEKGHHHHKSSNSTEQLPTISLGESVMN